MRDVLKVERLKKTFNQKEVISNVNLTIEKGIIYGLIGKNGAGKTTIMTMILGQLKPDQGKIYVDGIKVEPGGEKTNQVIGYAPDIPSFYNYMTGQEYLEFCAKITHFKSSDLSKYVRSILKKVGLTDVDVKKIKNYSRGMKQRLGIAQALLSKPKLLICDEPTSALDPTGRKEILELLVSLKEEMTIVLSTHILSDIEKICDKVGFLSHGKIVKEGNLSDLLTSNGHSNQLLITFASPSELFQFIEKYKGTILEISEEEPFVLVDCPIDDVMTQLLHMMLNPDSIKHVHPSLEQLYLEVVG